MSRAKPAKPASRRKSAPGKAGGLANASGIMGALAHTETSEATTRRTRAAKKKPKPRTREGKKGLVLYVLPEVTVALRKLALEQGSDVQTLGREALELLFAAYKTPLPPVSPEAQHR
ncbi:MAG: ribbon-helix-helix domain-containing protein [Hyphomicrobiaceae bacterium]